MALVLKDRVKETSSSSGTGNITLTGAFAGYQTFNAVVASGSTVYYTIHNLVPGFDTEWEVGVGTFTSPATLSRDTVLSSSIGAPTKTNFTSGTEGLEVFITQPAEEAVYINQATGKVEAFGNGTNTITFTEINTTNLTANTVTLTAGTISTNAANATDITNKQYVDGLFSQGVSYHEAVLVESPTNLVAVYNQPNGAGNGVGATLTNSGANVALSIDGVSLSNTARVLVYTQSNAVQNGIYTVTNPGAPDPGGAQWVLTRATDADTFGLANPNTLGAGDAVFVQSGNTGAGETYVCTTAGTITFGSSNITFAQISSAQIYAAGTGLNLSNLTFSIANTTVVSGLYGDSANVSVIEVNAQGQLTSASNSAINVSNITVGTLSNDRTTANASNGANTIVLRDASGSFAGNVGSFTTVNATNGNFTNITANASGLTDINASNITSGTISNDRTTGSTSNSASTLVLRDSNGNFGSNVITASLFSGDGSGINAINASNISSGTIANARTTAATANGASTIVLRDSGGSFDANTVNAVSLIGNAAQVTNINASNITSGTIGNAFTTANSSNGAATIVLRGASGEFSAGAITASSLSGNGASITALNATAITTGTIDNARTTASASNGANTIVLRDASGDFAVDGITANWLTGNGANLSAINASNISSGTIANARTTAATANGASTIVLRGTSGEFSAGAITAASFSGSGSGLTNIPNSATTAASANGASTIVSRDSGGNFSANTITANLTGTASSSSQVANSVTFNNGGAGDASGTTFNGSAARTISYNTIGAPSTTGTNASGTWGINISGNAVNLSTTFSNWSTNGTITAVVGQLAWKNYGNSHSIFDASASTTPSGTACSNTNAQNAWAGTYPTLMGWNGSQTYGVRVDSARVADSASSATTATTASTANALNTGNSYTVTDLYNNGWFRNNNSNQGLYNQSTTQHWSSGANGYWDASSTNTVCSIRFYTDGHVTNLRGYVYANNSNEIGFLTNAGGWSWRMDSSGNGTATGNVTAYSDERLKKDWADLPSDFIEKLSKVKHGTYTRTDINQRQVGASAQDMQKILPEAVMVGTDEDKTLALAYGNAALAACIELSKEVVKLREELEALKYPKTGA